MKVCPSCGKENKDSAKFCTGCGKSIEEVAAIPGEPRPDPVPAAAPVYAPAPAAAAVQPQAPVIARSPAQVRFKELASSKLALIICIAFTIMVLCSVCTSVFVPSTVANALKDGLAQLKDANLEMAFEDLNISTQDFNDMIDGAIASYETTAQNPAGNAARIISAVFANAISILFAVALWIIYGIAKDSDSVCCGTAGLKIIRVLRVIGMILAVILAVIFALLLVFGIFMSIREGYDNATTGFYILAGFTALVYILVFCFLGGCLSTLKRYISVSENRSGRARISGYAAVILFIGAVFSAIGAVTCIISVFTTGADMAVYAVSAAASAVYQFCLSKFIFRSKKALKTV